MSHAPATLSYCGEEVRRHDNDRFLTALFAPAERREALFAIYAFNIEVAKTREVVTEPMLGQIRLQWWRDAVEELYAGQVRRHEVLLALAQAVTGEGAGLSRGHFERVIDAREADLDDSPPASLGCLVNYADATGTPLVLLALEALGVRDETAAAAGRHVAIAWALSGLLRALPFHARAHRLYLPADLLAAKGVRHDQIFGLKPSPALSEVVRTVADTARTHLTEARALRRRLPRAAVPALLPATLADLSLRTLEQVAHDPFAPRLAMPHPMRHLRLAYRALTGRF